MSTTEPPIEPMDLTEGFGVMTARLQELQEEGLSGAADPLMADLETAHEELRVADEEVRA